MSIKFRSLSTVWLPLTLVCIYLVVVLLLKDIFPSSEEIMSSFANLFQKYGYEIVFFGALLEAALLIDFLVPGASVVLAGAYFASLGVLSYPIFLIVSSIGFFLGFLADYLIGFYGWSDILTKLGLGSQIQATKKEVEKWGGKSFFIGYIHPDSASFFALASGIIKMNLKTFVTYNFLAGTLWLLFWTGLVYIFGPQIEKLFASHLILILLSVPAIAVLYKILKRS